MKRNIKELDLIGLEDMFDMAWWGKSQPAMNLSHILEAAEGKGNLEAEGVMEESDYRKL